MTEWKLTVGRNGTGTAYLIEAAPVDLLPVGDIDAALAERIGMAMQTALAGRPELAGYRHALAEHAEAVLPLEQAQATLAELQARERGILASRESGLGAKLVSIRRDIDSAIVQEQQAQAAVEILAPLVAKRQATLAETVDATKADVVRAVRAELESARAQAAGMLAQAVADPLTALATVEYSSSKFMGILERVVQGLAQVAG